jgi:hypothetical protein
MAGKREGQRMAVMRDVRLKGVGIWCFFALVARDGPMRPSVVPTRPFLILTK